MKKISIKRLIIIIISALTLLCAAVGVTLMVLTHINKNADPTKKMISAMKNAGAEMAADLNERIEDYMNSLADGSILGYSGNIVCGKFTVDSTDYLDLIKTHSISYNYGTNAAKRMTGGEISIASDAGEPDVASLYFYIEDNTLYFKAPLLSAYNFKLATGTAAEYADKAIDENDDIDLGFDSNDISDFLKIFKINDSEESESYKKMLQSLVADLQVGYDKAAEEFTYTKLNDEAYSGSQGTYTAIKERYKVTVTKDALIAGADAAIDAIYDDDTISNYRTLISSYYKNSREKLKTAVRKRLENYEDSDMIIYVGENNRIVAMQKSENGGTAVIESFEQGKITHASFNICEDGKNVVYTVDRTSDDTCTFSLDLISEETNISIEGEASSATLDKLSVGASDFTNALDITQLTVSQYQSIMYQLMENYDVLEQIISDAE